MDSIKLKQVTDLTLDELLASVEAETPKQEEQLLDDVSTFLAVNKIKPGKHKVRKPFLYEFYKQWSKDPIGPHLFGNRARNFFEFNASYYFLDKKAYDIVSALNKLSVKPRDFTKSTRYRNHFEFFFTANGVKKGDFYFPVSMLHILYRTWCIKNAYNVRLRGNRFVAMCKTYFEYKDVKGEIMLKLNTSILKHLSKEQLEKLNGKKEN